MSLTTPIELEEFRAKLYAKAKAELVVAPPGIGLRLLSLPKAGRITPAASSAPSPS